MADNIAQFLRNDLGGDAKEDNALKRMADNSDSVPLDDFGDRFLQQSDSGHAFFGEARKPTETAPSSGGASMSGPEPMYGRKGQRGIAGTLVKPPAPRAMTPDELMAAANRMENDFLSKTEMSLAQGPSARRLAGGSHDTGYNTELTAGGEKAYRAWKEQYDPGDSGVDYDHRGFFNANEKRFANGHGTDRWKKPNHPTFSDESNYASGSNEKYAGHWGPGDENYIGPKGGQTYEGDPSGTSHDPSIPDLDPALRRQLGQGEGPPEWLSQYMSSQPYTDPNHQMMPGRVDLLGSGKYLSEKERLKQLRDEQRTAGLR